jgi:hypothetical protein
MDRTWLWIYYLLAVLIVSFMMWRAVRKKGSSVLSEWNKRRRRKKHGSRVRRSQGTQTGGSA